MDPVTVDVTLWPNDVVLVLRDRTGSGSWNAAGGNRSMSRPLSGSGDACIELLVVMPVVSGDKIGEHCCGLDVTEELLKVEKGADVMCDCKTRLVCT